MKLSIRSSVISTLSDILKELDTEKEYKFVFGKKTRTGFIPTINSFDFERVKTFLNSSSYVLSQTEYKQYSNILDIGVVKNYYIMFGYSGDSFATECLVYISPDCSHSILLFENDDNYQIEVLLKKIPITLQELFEPVKVLYGIIPELLTKEEDCTDIVSAYNILFEKEGSNPWIVPQGLSYLKKSNLGELRKHHVCPIRRGESYTLFLSELGGYLLSEREVFRITEDDIPESLYNTVISGDWHENQFYGYDISMFGGKDVRKQSLTKREKYLEDVKVSFSFCIPIKYYSIENVKDLIEDYGGVIFAPIRANYTNNRTYIYQRIENLSIYFKVSQNHLRYKTYTLKTGEEENVFSGNSRYSFPDTIPLFPEDREFVGSSDDCVFEFKWDISFYPVSYSNILPQTNTQLAKNIWTYINEYIEFDLLLKHI